MNDIQMTFLCAEALRGDDKSINISVDANGEVWNQWDDGSWAQLPRKFDPLNDNWHALSLVKKLGLTIDPQEDKPPFTWRVCVSDNGDWDNQPYAMGLDLNRAIVECVSKMKTTR